MKQTYNRRGVVEGVTLRRINFIPAGTPWRGTFDLGAGWTRAAKGTLCFMIVAAVRCGKRSADLNRTCGVRPGDYPTEDEFFARVLEKVREGMEYTKNTRGDRILQVLRVEWTDGTSLSAGTIHE